jgi:6-phosphogluconolactonase
VEIYFVDERAVPPDDSRSNYKLVKEALLDHVPIPAENVFRMQGEEPDVERAAHAYEQKLKARFPRAPGEPLPRLDFIVLGMGPDGHTASIFPGSPHLTTSAGHDRLVMPAVSPDGLSRLTLTLPVICAARRAILLANGGDKADTLKKVLKGAVDPATFPIQAVTLADGGEVEWILDKAIVREMLDRDTMAIRMPPGGFGSGGRGEKP